MKTRLMAIVAIVLTVSIALSVPTFAAGLSLENFISFATFTQENPDDGTTDVLPEEPAEPTDPVDPEAPDEPVDPDNPDNPDNPDEPVVPDNPDNPDNPDEPVDPDNPDNPDIPDEPDEPEPPKPTFDEIPGDTVVGRMYICTQIRFLGHSWIYIENDFAGDIPVGCLTVGEGSSASVGTFLFSRRDGMGIYYNVERYGCNEHGYKNPVWLGMEITKDQLLKVNKKITGFNYWDLYFNCTFFASQVWNSVSDDFIMPMMFPAFTKAQTKTKGGNGNVYMQPVSAEECYKQKGSGSDASLQQVKKSSLNTPIG